MPVGGYRGDLSEFEHPAMLLDNSRVLPPARENCHQKMGRIAEVFTRRYPVCHVLPQSKCFEKQQFHWPFNLYFAGQNLKLTREAAVTM